MRKLEAAGVEAPADLVLPWMGSFHLFSKDANGNDCTMKTEDSQYTANCYEDGSALLFSKAKRYGQRHRDRQFQVVTEDFVLVAHWPTSTEPPFDAVNSAPWASVRDDCMSPEGDDRDRGAEKVKVAKATRCTLTRCGAESEPQPRIIFSAAQYALTDSINLDRLLQFDKSISSKNCGTKVLDVRILPGLPAQPGTESGQNLPVGKHRKNRFGRKLKKGRQPFLQGPIVAEEDNVITMVLQALRVALNNAVGQEQQGNHMNLAGRKMLASKLQLIVAEKLNAGRQLYDQFNVGICVWESKPEAAWTGTRPLLLAGRYRAFITIEPLTLNATALLARKATVTSTLLCLVAPL